MTRTLISGGVVLDGNGGIFEDHEVVIEGDLIHSVRAAQSGSHGFDSVIDATGKTVMPGMIDTHVHIGGGDFDPSIDRVPLAEQAFRSLEAAQRSLIAGFTTIRSAGARENLDVHVRNAINTGLTWGPRVLASGRGITHTGGHCSEFAIEADGSQSIRSAVRRLVGAGVDSIKLFGVSAGVASAGADVNAPGFNVDEIRAAIDEAERFGRLVQVHAIGLAAVKNAIKAGVRSIDHGHMLDEEVCAQMQSDRIVLVPTFGPSYYYTVRREAEPWRVARADAVREAHIASFKLALSAGVTIAMGSDLGYASRMKNGENALELEEMVAHGMLPERAIIAATSEAARVLHLEDVLGTLEAGKKADILIVDGNPLEDISVLRAGIQFVMKDGVCYLDRSPAVVNGGTWKLPTERPMVPQRAFLADTLREVPRRRPRVTPACVHVAQRILHTLHAQ